MIANNTWDAMNGVRYDMNLKFEVSTFKNTSRYKIFAISTDGSKLLVSTFCAFLCLSLCAIAIISADGNVEQRAVTFSCTLQ